MKKRANIFKHCKIKKPVMLLPLLLLFLAVALFLSACDTESTPESVITVQPATDAGDDNQSATGSTDSLAVVTEEEAGEEESETSADDASEDDSADSASAGSGGASIVLKDTTATISGTGAKVSGSTVNITAGGTYDISGTLKDGQIIVYAGDNEVVELVLNGAVISSSQSGAIEILNCDKTVINLAAGTENTVSDTDTADVSDSGSDVADAAIFSKCDVTVKGTGSLTVISDNNNGIKTADGLKINGGNIIVKAALDAIRGKDYVKIKDGTVTVTAGSDGIQSTNADDPERGYVEISGGTLKITTAKDGIQAETAVLVSGGEIDIVSGGGSNEVSSQNKRTGTDSESTKGIKAQTSLSVTGGRINIDAADDALHSNGSIVMDGGELFLDSGDDGIHADTSVTINKGALAITGSYEGIESQAITVNGGTVHIVSSDDGINVAGGNDGSPQKGPMGQQDSLTASGDSYLRINGGYIAIDANGDGVDIGGYIAMSGGTLLISGPQLDNNGALDYGSSFVMTGGYLVAAGSAGMAQAPSDSSGQYAVMVNFESSLEAGTLVRIESSGGEDIVTFKPARQYRSIVVCSPELAEGGTYTVSTGGSSTGTSKDGLYSGGNYSGGAEYTEFTISSIITIIGTTGGMGPGGGPGGGLPPDGSHQRPEKP